MNLENLKLVQLSTKEVEETEGGFLVELCIAGMGACMWAFDHGVAYGRSLH